VAHGKAAGADNFSEACCGEAIKLVEEVLAWIAARDAAWRRASASKLARPDGALGEKQAELLSRERLLTAQQT
jgi:hypothetical protein